MHSKNSPDPEEMPFFSKELTPLEKKDRAMLERALFMLFQEVEESQKVTPDSVTEGGI